MKTLRISCGAQQFFDVQCDDAFNLQALIYKVKADGCFVDDNRQIAIPWHAIVSMVFVAPQMLAMQYPDKERAN